MVQTDQPNVPPGTDLEPPLNDSDLAEQEQEAVRRESLANEHRRTERLRDLAFWCVCAVLALFVIVACTAIIVLTLHYLSPWTWLREDQLTAVRTFLFSGAVTGAVGWMGNYVRSRL